MKYTEMIAEKVRRAVESGTVKTLEEWRAWIAQNVPGVVTKDKRLTTLTWNVNVTAKNVIHLPKSKRYGLIFYLEHTEGYVFAVYLKRFYYVTHPRWGAAPRSKDIATFRVAAGVEAIRQVYRDSILNGLRANAEVLFRKGKIEECVPLCGIWPKKVDWDWWEWEAYSFMEESGLTPILSADWKVRKDGRIDVLIKREDGKLYLGSYRGDKIEWRKEALTFEEYWELW